MEAPILDAAPQEDGTTHWSTRKLAAVLGTAQHGAARVWAKHGLMPHRIERYMPPAFEEKAADIIGYHWSVPEPPAYAARVPVAQTDVRRS